MSLSSLFPPHRDGVSSSSKSTFSALSTMVALATGLLLFAPSSIADEAKTESPKNKTPATTEKAPEPVKIAGVFEAVVSGEVSFANEHFTALEIKRLLPHGTEVNKGQNVVWFDTEDVDEKIKQAELDLKLAELALADENFKYEQFIKTQSLEKVAAQRTRKQAQQKFDNYTGTDRDREVLGAEFSLKLSRSSLDNAAEELKQLEQMYQEDDLTEESEEIVLRRAKQAVESAQYRLDGTKIATQRALEQAIPRKEANEKDVLERAQLAYQKSMKGLTNARARQDIEIARKREKFEKEKEKFEEMQDERKQMVLKAPNAGTVLHGKLTRGKLSEKPSTLKAGSKVSVDQVIATVVNPAKLQVRVNLDEKHLALVKRGVKCTIIPKPFPKLNLKGTVKSVSRVPYAGSKYDCVITFHREKNDAISMPVMGCDIQFEVAVDVKKDSKKEKKR